MADLFDKDVKTINRHLINICIYIDRKSRMRYNVK